MKFLLDSKEMKQIDSITIDKFGIPDIVLMEKAALSVAQIVMNSAGSNDRILAVCGTGNNGADGIACARILFMKGYLVDIAVIGDMDKASSLFTKQMNIALNLGISIYSKLELREYTIVVDAIFGVGINRTLNDYYKKIIEEMNKESKLVIAVDIPSGLSADNGKPLGAAIKANYTVTFGFYKKGLVMYPGCELAGQVCLFDIGFAKLSKDSVNAECYFYESSDLLKLPKRQKNSNKGTYGKVLVIAGSDNMSGACFFSAKAAYKTGAGLVKVITSRSNKDILLTQLPEALLYTYDTDPFDLRCLEEIKKLAEWANVVVLGPGIGFCEASLHIFSCILEGINTPLILDADALQMVANLANENVGRKDIRERIKYITKILPKNTILTPHIKELSNLLGISVDSIKEDIFDIADICTEGNDLIFAMKDARTIVAYKSQRYVNMSGNNGMSTGGSGDVLTGIIAGLMAQGLRADKAAELGVYIHGLSGDQAKEEYGEYSLIASDIINMLPVVMKNGINEINTV